MARECPSCKQELIVNSKLGLMECVSGKHYAPINITRPQWWNSCPKCNQTGLNDIDCERMTQAFNNNKPVTKKVGDKKYITVFNENENQKPYTCKACGHSFIKKGAFN